MEQFGSEPEDALETCLSELLQSDAMILVLGERYGTISGSHGVSYTEMEYEAASALGIPVYVYSVEGQRSDLSLPPETAEASRKYADFRERVFSERTVTTLRNASNMDLAEAILKDLSQKPGGPGVAHRPHFDLQRQLVASPIQYGVAGGLRSFYGEPIKVVLVDVSAAEGPELPGPERGRLTRKIRGICANLKSRNVPTWEFNEIEIEDPRSPMFEERVKVLENEESLVVLFTPSKRWEPVRDKLESTGTDRMLWYANGPEPVGFPCVRHRAYEAKQLIACTVGLEVEREVLDYIRRYEGVSPSDVPQLFELLWRLSKQAVVNPVAIARVRRGMQITEQRLEALLTLGENHEMIVRGAGSILLTPRAQELARSISAGVEDSIRVTRRGTQSFTGYVPAE